MSETKGEYDAANRWDARFDESLCGWSGALGRLDGLRDLQVDPSTDAESRHAQALAEAQRDELAAVERLRGLLREKGDA